MTRATRTTTIPSFSPRFSTDKIKDLIEQYGSVDQSQLDIGARAKALGYYTQPDFVAICNWKTRGRPRRYYIKNTEQGVQKQTSIALTDPNEETRIRALLLLNGVGLPTASMLLHLASPDQYPVIDFRTLWSLGCESAHINVSFWLKYVHFCRDLSAKWGKSLRDLDRALFQYSKNNQPKKPKESKQPNTP